MKRKLYILSVLSLLFSLTAVFLYKNLYQSSNDFEQKNSITGLLEGGPTIPPFVLVNQSGETIDESLFNDKYSLLFFGFTFCPDICPITLSYLTSVNIESQTVFITVDPSRDTPSKIHEYLQNFSANFIGLTGEESVLLRLWSSLGISVHTISDPDTGSYNVTHNGIIFLISPSRQMIGLIKNVSSSSEIEAIFDPIINQHKEI
jgi:protein SCO1